MVTCRTALQRSSIWIFVALLVICPALLAGAKTKPGPTHAAKAPAKAKGAGEPVTQILQQVYDQSCRSGKARCGSEGVARSSFSADLRKAYFDVVGNEVNAQRVKDGAIKDVIDFDVFTDTKDYVITDLRLSTLSQAKAEADKVTARAEFNNSGQPVKLEFDFIRVGDAWKINNIHWRNRDTSLRALIAVLQAK